MFSLKKRRPYSRLSNSNLQKYMTYFERQDHLIFLKLTSLKMQESFLSIFNMFVD